MSRTLSLLLVAFVLVAPVLTFAQGLGGTNNTQTTTGTSLGGTDNTRSTTLMNPLKGGATLTGFLNSILDLFIRIGSIVLVVMVIYIGFLFIVAQGNPESLGKAKTMLLWTLIGGLILLGAKGIAMGVHATVEALSQGR